MTQDLMNVEKAAQRLGGVSNWSIYSWLRQGKLKKTKVGSRVMIAESDLQAFLAQCNPEKKAQPIPESSQVNEPKLQ